jgi:hypothetical protein
MNGAEKSKNKQWLNQERLFWGVILIVVFTIAARPPLVGDMWWHLKAGQVTWETGVPLRADVFSHTREGASWVNHSWLAQVGMYLLYRLDGLQGVSFGFALMAVLSMALLLKQLEGGIFWRVLVIFLASLVSMVVWTPRPQTISLVFFALVGLVLHEYKWKGRNHLPWLIPIFILWSNLHGGYVLGLILIGTMVGGEILNHLLGHTGETVLSWGAVVRLVMWGAAGAFLVVLNPNGVGMWLIPFQTVGVNVLQDYISEWSSPDFHRLVQQPFLWMLLAVFGAVGLSKRRLDGSDLVGVALFSYASLVSRRQFGPFALAVAPVLSRHLSVLIPRWRKRLEEAWPWFGKMTDFSKKTERSLGPGRQQIINGLILVLLCVAAVIKMDQVTNPDYMQELQETAYPAGAVKWVRKNQPEGKMFNDYNWGGYLIWHLPEYPVFVDGRTDLYGDEVLEDYLRVMQGKAGWEEILKEYDIQWVILPFDPLRACKLQEEGWIMDYQDRKSMLLTH